MTLRSLIYYLSLSVKFRWQLQTSRSIAFARDFPLLHLENQTWVWTEDELCIVGKVFLRFISFKKAFISTWTGLVLQCTVLPNIFQIWSNSTLTFNYSSWSKKEDYCPLVEHCSIAPPPTHTYTLQEGLFDHAEVNLTAAELLLSV